MTLDLLGVGVSVYILYVLDISKGVELIHVWLTSLAQYPNYSDAYFT